VYDAKMETCNISCRGHRSKARRWRGDAETALVTQALRHGLPSRASPTRPDGSGSAGL